MPTCKQYQDDIAKAHNIANTHHQADDLIRWHGDLLRQFIEVEAVGKVDKPAAGHQPKLKLDKKNKAADLADGMLKQGKDMTFAGTVTKKSMETLATHYRLAANAADQSAQNATGDEKSEYLVNAAVDLFRAALSTYVGDDLKNRQPQPGAAGSDHLSYTRLLTDAAKRLMDAKLNEGDDADDLREQMAEVIVANTLFKEAQSECTLIKNHGVVFTPAKPFDDTKADADKGVTDTDKQINDWVS